MATHQKKHIKNIGKKEFPIRDPTLGESYATVGEALGDSRWKVKLVDGRETIASIRGALKSGKNKQRINKGDIVLVQSSLDLTTILHRYIPDEVKKLRKLGEILQTEEQTSSTSNIEFEDSDNEPDNTVNQKVEIDDDFLNDL
jgi:initiation factor 1A